MPEMTGSLPSFDDLLKEHNQRNWEDVAAVEKQRQLAAATLGSTQEELTATQQALVRAREELAQLKATLDEHRQAWEESMGRIQKTFGAREAKLVEEEAALLARVAEADAAGYALAHREALLNERTTQLQDTLTHLQTQMQMAFEESRKTLVV